MNPDALLASADLRRSLGQVFDLLREKDSEIAHLRAQLSNQATNAQQSGPTFLSSPTLPTLYKPTVTPDPPTTLAPLLARCFEWTRNSWNPASLSEPLHLLLTNPTGAVFLAEGSDERVWPAYYESCRMFAVMHDAAKDESSLPLLYHVAGKNARRSLLRADAMSGARVKEGVSAENESLQISTADKQKLVGWFEKAMTARGAKRVASSSFTSGYQAPAVPIKRALSLDVTRKTAKPDDLYQLFIDLRSEIALSFCSALKPVDIDDAAKYMVELFADSDRIYPLLFRAIEEEVDVAVTSTGLFRGNDYRTKMVLYYFTMISPQYLRKTLHDPIRSILNASSSLEVDPKKLRDGQDVVTNQRTLAQYSQSLLQLILMSIPDMPEPVKVLSRYIHEAVSKRFPDSARSAVIVLIFLRLLGPCITFPSKIGITDGNTDIHNDAFQRTRALIMTL